MNDCLCDLHNWKELWKCTDQFRTKVTKYTNIFDTYCFLWAQILLQTKTDRHKPTWNDQRTKCLFLSISRIEAVQRRPAGFVSHGYHNTCRRDAAKPQLANPGTTPQVSTSDYDVQNHHQAVKGTQPKTAASTPVPSETWPRIVLQAVLLQDKTQKDQFLPKNCEGQEQPSSRDSSGPIPLDTPSLGGCRVSTSEPTSLLLFFFSFLNFPQQSPVSLSLSLSLSISISLPHICFCFFSWWPACRSSAIFCNRPKH